MGNHHSKNVREFTQDSKSRIQSAIMEEEPSFQYAPPPYRILARRSEETDEEYEYRSYNLESLFKYSKFYSHDVDDDWYDYLGRLLAIITWDTVPSKDWNKVRCQLWIRAYLKRKIPMHFRDATKAAERFTENGRWMLYMGLEDWIRICPTGGRSIWRLLQDLKEEGKL